MSDTPAPSNKRRTAFIILGAVILIGAIAVIRSFLHDGEAVGKFYIKEIALVLTGVVRLNDGEYVTIASRDQSQRFGLMSGETYNGITVASVAWSDAIGKTKVTLKRGSEYGVVSFDEAVVNNNGAAGPTLGGAQPNATILPAGITLPNPDTTGNPPPSPGKPLLRRRVIQTVPPK